MKKILFIVALFLCLSFTSSASDITVRDIDSEAWLDHINYMGQVRRQILRTLTKSNPTIHDRRMLKNLEHAFDVERERWNQYLVDLASGKIDKSYTSPDTSWLDQDGSYHHRRAYEQRRIKSAAYHSKHRKLHRHRSDRSRHMRRCCRHCCCAHKTNCCCDNCEKD